MSKIARLLPLLLLMAGVAAAQQSKPAAKPQTMATVLDGQLHGVEGEFVPAADAMPEDKYSYAPTNGEFKGVRTFAEQARHVATINYLIGSAMLGEKPPADIEGANENGPASIKTKADIMARLKASFEYLHKAYAGISEQNALAPIKSPFGSGTTTRLGLATLTVGHCFDHYGQMVEYLRSNGIVPPASRPQPARK